MILTADSTVARETARRRTASGWHTTFIGENRMTRTASEPPAAEGALYPMAFLVEREPGAVVKPHFHQADQYQVVVAGGGRFGVHDVASVSVHYTDAYSAYGPIVPDERGIAWFTLRNAWDPGARYMPGERAVLRAARERFSHREAAAGPLPVLSEADLVRVETGCLAVLEPGPDGLATWRYRLSPGTSLRGPDPRAGGGQYWVVLAGSLSAQGSAPLPAQSCVFVGPDDGPAAITAGMGGTEVLCLQFPARAQH